MLNKYRSLMPSLALIDHLINIADGTQENGPVSLHSAERAAAWCDYLETHARRIYSLVGDIGQKAAAELAKKIKSKKIQSGFTLRDVYRNQWHLLTDKEAVKITCHELEEAGWVKGIVPREGKTRTVYHVNPKVFLDMRGGTN